MKEKTISIPLNMAVDQNEAIQEAVRQESSRLFNFIRKRVGDDEMAEDILQDVFYQLVHTYRAMRPVEHISAWLFRVARNRITDVFRKKKPDTFTQQESRWQGTDDDYLGFENFLPHPDEDAEGLMARSAVLEAVDEALEELPKLQRDVFVMHEVDGMTFTEIAEMTGVSVNTLLSRKRYAVQFLRKRLRSLYDEFVND